LGEGGIVLQQRAPTDCESGADCRQRLHEFASGCHWILPAALPNERALFERTESNNKQGESLFDDRTEASVSRSDAIARVTLGLQRCQAIWRLIFFKFAT
jgi:hypothetical protein